MSDMKAIETAVDALIDEAHADGVRRYLGNSGYTNESRTALLTLIEGVCRERDGLREMHRALVAACRHDHGGNYYDAECPICAALAATDEVQK